MKIVNEYTPGSTQFKDVPFGVVFYCNDISNVYIKTSNALYIKRLIPSDYGETKINYDPVNAISAKDTSFVTFFRDDAVVTPLPNSFLTLK